MNLGTVRLDLINHSTRDESICLRSCGFALQACLSRFYRGNPPLHSLLLVLGTLTCTRPIFSRMHKVLGAKGTCPAVEDHFHSIQTEASTEQKDRILSSLLALSTSDYHNSCDIRICIFTVPETCICDNIKLLLFVEFQVPHVFCFKIICFL